MSELSKLYQGYNAIKEIVPEVAERIKDDIAKAEERIIKKEILPRVREIVGEALKEVRDELVLVIDYKPGQPVSLHLSREAGVVDKITDAKEIVLDEEVEHATHTVRTDKITRVNRYPLSVVFPDGTEIAEPRATDTLQKTIEKIGVQRVRQAVLENDIRLAKVPLVSNRLDEKYGAAQRALGGGLYVITHGSNVSKKRVLEKLSDALALELTVTATQTRYKPTDGGVAESMDFPAVAEPADAYCHPDADCLPESSPHGFSVTFPDGTVVCEPTAAETLVSVVKKIGVQRVLRAAEENGIAFYGIPLVSRTHNEKYNQQDLGGGLWLITHADNKRKKRALKKLSAALGLGLSVSLGDVNGGGE